MKKFVRLNRSGFTLIEVIVVAAIIAILAGILVPMIFSQVEESRTSKAKGDAKSIQTAIQMFKKDVGKWPYYTDNTPGAPVTCSFLHTGTDAQVPTLSAGFDDTTSVALADQLESNKFGYVATMWKGPYLTENTLDPWGKAYVINAGNFDSNPPEIVWVMSAGPDGVIQTPAQAKELCTTVPVPPALPAPISPCDDIGIRLN